MPGHAVAVLLAFDHPVPPERQPDMACTTRTIGRLGHFNVITMADKGSILDLANTVGRTKGEAGLASVQHKHATPSLKITCVCLPRSVGGAPCQHKTHDQKHAFHSDQSMKIILRV